MVRVNAADVFNIYDLKTTLTYGFKKFCIHRESAKERSGFEGQPWSYWLVSSKLQE
jgi:hypothetical protein